MEFPGERTISPCMRGADFQHRDRGGYVQPEECVPQGHPLRKIREMVNGVLKEMSSFLETLYVPFGRSSIAPEYLLRALLLQIFFTIRSERQLMEQMRYNLLFRWFVGLGIGDPIWDVTVFTKNRDRLLDSGVAQEFFERILGLARAADLLSDEHFTVDGTLIEAWASHKSFQRKDDDAHGDGGSPKQVSDLGEGGKNPSVDFRGEKRSNVTHASITDPDARLARKNAGSAAVLAHSGHVTMENRSGLVVKCIVTPPSGVAERAATAHMMINLLDDLRAAGKLPATSRLEPVTIERLLASDGAELPPAQIEIEVPPNLLGDEASSRNHDQPRKIKITLGADKAYDCPVLVTILRHFGIEPHIARNTKRPGGSALDAKIEKEPGYAVSQRKRKLVEEIFGWSKVIGTIRKTKMRGTALVGWMFTLNAAAYNVVRMVKLFAQRAAAAAAAT